MSIYDTLNQQQKEAVFTTEGPVLVLAGAGSGKTRVLTHRIAYLVDEMEVNPFNIMAITFTNKAAGEMKERVKKLVGMGSDSIWVSTFHSSCVRILRRYADRLGYEDNFTIYDADDSKNIMKDVCKKLSIDTKILKERTILNAISTAKDELLPYDQFRIQYSSDFRMSRIADAYEEYQKTLKSNNAMDFDDLIMNTVLLFREHADVLDSYQKKFKYIMVDEYQDTNTSQFQLIKLLAGGSKNLCVVGDDDQSIYKFRGANVRNILDFEYYYPEAKVIRLEQNYRSTQNILDAANGVIANNVGRKDKSLWTDNKGGSLIHFRQFDSAYEEAEFIADDIAHKFKRGEIEYNDAAVLYRTNAQSRLLEERFIYEGIPYNVVGGVNFYSRKEIKDILAYLKTIDNGKDDLQVKRIINVPKRGIGNASIAKVQDYADYNGISFFEALCEADGIPSIGKSAKKLISFANMIKVFRSRMYDLTLTELIRDVLDTTEYIQEFDAQTEEEAQNRIENIEEFINKVILFEQEHENATLSELLEEVSLVADIDNISEDVPRALLMTLHSAKGLEFKHVYISGMEDGLFPGFMSISSDDSSEIEEERRLAYVGITRAREDLTLTYARSRMIRGETQYNAVSRFVREIPKSLLDNKPSGGYRDEYVRSISETSAMEDNSYRYNGASIYNKPVAVLKPKTTSQNVKPFIAKAGLDGLKALGVTKGIPGGTDTQAKETGSGKLDYDVDDRVLHVKYGEGTVLEIEPGPRDYKITVDFDDAGTKIMYAAFAKLKKI